MSFIITTAGEYLGKTKNKNKEILIISKTYLADLNINVSQLLQNKSESLLNPKTATTLTGDSEKNPGYQKPISISEQIWKKIESDGGKRPKPVITNQSSVTVYIKPEGKVLHGPGKILDHKTPIALPPNGTIYGRIDGVNTPWKGKAVFKAVNGTKMKVLANGKVKIISYEKWTSRLGQLWKGGWKDRRKRSSWVALSKTFHNEESFS